MTVPSRRRPVPGDTESALEYNGQQYTTEKEADEEMSKQPQPLSTRAARRLVRDSALAHDLRLTVREEAVAYLGATPIVIANRYPEELQAEITRALEIESAPTALAAWIRRTPGASVRGLEEATGIPKSTVQAYAVGSLVAPEETRRRIEEITGPLEWPEGKVRE